MECENEQDVLVVRGRAEAQEGQEVQSAGVDPSLAAVWWRRGR